MSLLEQLAPSAAAKHATMKGQTNPLAFIRITLAIVPHSTATERLAAETRMHSTMQGDRVLSGVTLILMGCTQ